MGQLMERARRLTTAPYNNALRWVPDAYFFIFLNTPTSSIKKGTGGYNPNLVKTRAVKIPLNTQSAKRP